MPEHPDTLIWVAGVKPALVARIPAFLLTNDVIRHIV